MDIDLEMIRARFDDVLSGKCTREEASDWARQLRESNDARDLVVTPKSDWKRVWDAIGFLEGYDMKNSPNEYLFAEVDLIAERP